MENYGNRSLPFKRRNRKGAGARARALEKLRRKHNPSAVAHLLKLRAALAAPDYTLQLLLDKVDIHSAVAQRDLRFNALTSQDDYSDAFIEEIAGLFPDQLVEPEITPCALQHLTEICNEDFDAVNSIHESSVAEQSAPSTGPSSTNVAEEVVNCEQNPIPPSDFDNLPAELVNYLATFLPCNDIFNLSLALYKPVRCPRFGTLCRCTPETVCYGMSCGFTHDATVFTNTEHKLTSERGPLNQSSPIQPRLLADIGPNKLVNCSNNSICYSLVRTIMRYNCAHLTRILLWEYHTRSALQSSIPSTHTGTAPDLRCSVFKSLMPPALLHPG
jgi:hypothetical protein